MCYPFDEGTTNLNAKLPEKQPENIADSNWLKAVDEQQTQLDVPDVFVDAVQEEQQATQLEIPAHIIQSCMTGQDQQATQLEYPEHIVTNDKALPQLQELTQIEIPFENVPHSTNYSVIQEVASSETQRPQTNSLGINFTWPSPPQPSGEVLQFNKKQDNTFVNSKDVNATVTSAEQTQLDTNFDVDFPVMDDVILPPEHKVSSTPPTVQQDEEEEPEPPKRKKRKTISNPSQEIPSSIERSRRHKARTSSQLEKSDVIAPKILVTGYSPSEVKKFKVHFHILHL